MSTEQQSAAEHVVDRTGWPAGEWDGEPDKLSWTDATTGLPCLIVRNRMGALCGYVAVDSTHRLYRTDYDPRAFTDALLRPTDDLDVALALSGADILAEFGADPQVERSIAAILDGLADGRHRGSSRR